MAFPGLYAVMGLAGRFWGFWMALWGGLEAAEGF
jgi:hypothetical protein